ncbi:hypothetical protein Pedsa_0753 [Pseudopedobacter saltans DSM 12145]|uniref:DUF3307 domain-containing protein n=1 Tax=Pseudopedobacter saltans (strain ATCC 51119 / DSM 12145 / JCM 21818 / CCUG 39354 / LMG 10337 / NBRC 100064 / NCIMB 13643) TaxID=762903 RepID=F0S928_PSESL|nr:DUF3307 domain-containing protein [Pseudopedobacter saltans]ADY51326.1 hypothetical protein Pedsa_0753 [Pseudopedobacter saltans DSM 12145]
MYIFILKLILAHIIGDFSLQSNKWIAERNRNGAHSKYLYYHIGVHTLLILLFFIGSLSEYWLGLLIILISHFFIDLGKIYLEKKSTGYKLLLFTLDQLLHIIVIALVFYGYFGNVEMITMSLSIETIMLYAIAFLMVTSVAPTLLKLFFNKWYSALKENDESLDTDSLKDAGKYIGILERILIVTFISINFLEGIGYLLAAKSIFRFGDLTNSKDKKLTEYILLGTLISFSIALIVGLILRELLNLL